jgi:hypothetical protein
VLCLISTFLTYQMSVIPETVCAVFDIYIFDLSDECYSRDGVCCV